MSPITLKQEVRNKLGIPADAWVIGSVGRLAHVKGYDRLITAFAVINRSQTSDHRPETIDPKGENTPREDAKGMKEDRSVNMDVQDRQDGKGGVSVSELSCKSCLSMLNPSLSGSNVYSLKSEVFLLLVGDGPERANLERQAGVLGVADRVIFAGYQADPVPYLQAMHMFVLPSRSEGLPVALLEAMAAGVPVAVTDVGANRDVVEDGRCGVVLPDDDSKWEEIISTMMNDLEAVDTRILAATQHVHEHYSLSATLDGYERCYHHVESEHRWQPTPAVSPVEPSPAAVVG